MTIDEKAITENALAVLQKHIFDTPELEGRRELIEAWKALRYPVRESVDQKSIDKKIAIVEAKFRPEYNNGHMTVGEIHMIRKAITALYEIEGGKS